MLQRVDLHVHSLHSSKPYSWFLRSLRSAECYTRVAEVYRLAHERGMTAVTISDHDTIDGALELCAEFPGTFISEEISARFPEDGCVVHTIAVDLTEAQHQEIQRLRRNIYELVPYMVSQNLPFFWCHPLSHVNSRLRPWHLRACLLMFRLLEVRNGTRATAHEERLRAIVGDLSPEVLARFAEEQPRAPWVNREARYGFVGGSDDHGAVGVARAYTTYEGEATGASIRAALHALAVAPAGLHGTGQSLAHNAYGVAAGTVKSSGQLGEAIAKATLPSSHDGGTAAAPPSGSMMRFLGGLRSAFSAVGGTFESVRARGHLDELHHALGGAAEAALVRQWRAAATHLASELRAGRVADAADAVPDLLKLALAELPYVLAYRYFARDRGAAFVLPRELPVSAPAQAAPRVAIVSDTTEDTNGVAIGLSRLIERARALGYPIELIGPSDGERIDEPRPGYTRVPSVYAHRLAEYASYAWHVPHLPALLRVLCDRHIDVVQVATPGPMGVAASIAGRLLGLPVIGQYHTDVPRYALHLLGDPTAAQLVERFVLWFYRSLDLVLVPSRFTAKDLLGKGVDEAKLQLISRGVPVRELAATPADPELRQRLCGDREAFLVLYVGRVSREKNLEAALEGFVRLRRAVPQAHFLIVGDGPLRAELAARQLEQVHLPGEVFGAELASLYASSDVFLFPSETDTFANAVVEAMAAGLPIVTAAGSAAAEHCVHGANGFAVEVNDPTEVAMRLTWLLQNPALRSRMAQESRALARRYDLDAAAHGLYSVYAALMRDGGGRASRRPGSGSGRAAGGEAASIVASPAP